MSRVRKVGGCRKLQFYRTDSCKISTEEIVNAKNFNFVPKFPKMEGSAQMWYFWGKKSDKK